MSVKFHHHHTFVSPSTQWIAQKSSKVRYFYQVGDAGHSILCSAISGKKCWSCTDCDNQSSSYKYLKTRKHHLFSHKPKRARNLLLFASSKDDITANASSEGANDVEAMRVRLDQALQNEDFNGGLVQALYDAARVFELSIKERSSLSKTSWFSAAWVGVDKNAWTKVLSYQASVYALLQAANEISLRQDGADKDVNISVQRSLLRLSAPLETVIRESLSGKQPGVFEWFWNDQIPTVITTFVNHFERDPRFKAATVLKQQTSHGSVNASGVTLIVLALVCITVITKLGPAKVSCPQFTSMIPDVTGTLMDVLVNLIPIREAYHAVKEIGLRREFLAHFGPRAAYCGVRDIGIADETVFWVDLVQKQLQRAIHREKIWSRLTTSESIEVLKRDLAIFGFFIALGRSTRSFLAANGFDKIDEPIEDFVRYLIGGCILYYPQFSSVNSYELYVEVVCEALDWLTFYPGYSNNPSKYSHGNKSKSEIPSSKEALVQALDVCSRWITIFTKQIKWAENPSNVKAAKFLSKAYDKLQNCKKELGLVKDQFVGSQTDKNAKSTITNSNVGAKSEADSFDEALERVENALLRLEKLLLDMHVSNPDSGKENLRAACSDLEKIRKLKKEAEFLEASFRAKAASLQEADKWAGSYVVSSADTEKSDPEKIHRFELLRSELMELEKRVQQSTKQSENEEDIEYGTAAGSLELIPVQKNGGFIEKSLTKLKETGTDVLQGTQLLAIDVGAATGLLRRAIVGDELTEKEKKFLRRTLTDLASVVPIGILMLLPVTAVGHAAMLAAIQRYVPALIPSTYGSERLDLLRQLEKMKQIDTSEAKLEENAEEVA